MLTTLNVHELHRDHPNYGNALRYDCNSAPDVLDAVETLWDRWCWNNWRVDEFVHRVNGEHIVAPSSWSETAVQIAYTRWAYKGEPVHERSIYDMAFRLAYTWASRGLELGYFDSRDESDEFMYQCFEDILLQRWFPNSPQWFNTGIYDVYGIEGEDCGLWKVLPGSDGVATPVRGRYVYPQVSACFIQGVEDDLTENNGILPSIANEARLFKMGSGVGSNWSTIRHKNAPLSNGGHSSGLISFLRIGDTNAGAIKSGGTTRRAAKMVVLDVDHPDIVEFVEWKLREEDKVAQMAWASQQLQGKTPEELRDLGFPKALVDRVALGHAVNPLDLDFNGEAVNTVSGQNSNNSIRIPDAFLEAVDNNAPWELLSPVDGSVVAEIPAKALWDKICLSAWACADPGVQFSDLIEADNPVKHLGSINASNPCSEYLFLDDTSCNLASVNLVKFLSSVGRLDLELLRETARRITKVLDISISIASFPSKAIAEGTDAYRTLGMGFSNLGGLLMSQGIPYDSRRGRDVARDIAKLMMQAAQEESAHLGERLGSFRGLSEESWEVFDQQYGSSRVPWFVMRNAQHMVIAPCGTIGLGMDCDALGIEPCLGLITYKKLADSDEVLTLVNTLVPVALKALGYSEDQILTFEECLLETGGDFKSAADRIGMVHDHREVFATSLGTPNVPWEAHVKMLAAVQPHISGGISKTINMPEESTVEDVSRAYRMAHDLGVKCVALFRNGCKDAPYSVSPRKEPAEHPEQDGSPPSILGIPEGLLASTGDTRDLVFRKLLVGAWNGWSDDVLKLAIRTEHEREGTPLSRAQQLDSFSEIREAVEEYREGTAAEMWDPDVAKVMDSHTMREASQPRYVNGDWQHLVSLADSWLGLGHTYETVLHSLRDTMVSAGKDFGELAEYQILHDALEKRSADGLRWVDEFSQEEPPKEPPEPDADKDLAWLNEIAPLRSLYVTRVVEAVSEGRRQGRIAEMLTEDNTADGAPFSCEELDEVLEEGKRLAKVPPDVILNVKTEVSPHIAKGLAERMAKVPLAPFATTPILETGRREPLPLASAVKVKATVAGQHTMHVTVPTFDDGTPSEVFIETGDTGSSTNALMDTVARLSSKCLQMGLPVDELVDLLQSVQFEPSGIVSGPEQFKNAKGGPLFVNSPLGVVAKTLSLVAAQQRQQSVEPVKSTMDAIENAPYPPVTSSLPQIRGRHSNERCPACKSPNIIPSGVCKVCADCGESVGGCS